MKTVEKDPHLQGEQAEQGEGKATAARPVRKATETFVARAKVADPARKASPHTQVDAPRSAEAQGLAKARR